VRTARATELPKRHMGKTVIHFDLYFIAMFKETYLLDLIIFPAILQKRRKNTKTPHCWKIHRCLSKSWHEIIFDAKNTFINPNRDIYT
jgi:hypothetical protein